ncbi:hypothetical protein F2Q68_00033817 [Brassica cretica]|uniref:Uncharacterized protein n=1 Tax=Brassica cretica TaxID=69181 RepID=A0A8S9H1C2_BRACR|nr:hypothetical protein F2Q68_00033817 [Brassica cretica]
MAAALWSNTSRKTASSPSLAFNTSTTTVTRSLLSSLREEREVLHYELSLPKMEFPFGLIPVVTVVGQGWIRKRILGGASLDGLALKLKFSERKWSVTVGKDSEYPQQSYM